jgi:hypothetical protein
MNIPPRIRLVGYVTGYLLAGVWAALAPYLAHRGVDSYTVALVSGVVAVAAGGLHAVAAGHITLPSSEDVTSLPVDDGSDLSVATLDPAATDVPATPPAPVAAPVDPSAMPTAPTA